MAKYDKVTKYDKLVRDLIPDIIRSKGREPVIHVASQEEYSASLCKKLQEEVDEYIESGSVEELADIMEVVYALGTLAGADRARVEQIRQEKATERGGFEKRIILEKA